MLSRPFRHATSEVGPGTPRANAAAVLQCDALTKVFCDSFEQGRRYAFRDIVSVWSARRQQVRAGERVVVDRFSVTVRPGENVVVLGMSEAGKTTIAKLLTGMLRPDGGHVRLHGRVGLVRAAKLAMNPFLTVWEYVQLATSICGVEPDVADQCCEDVLAVTRLTDERDKKIVDVRKDRLRYLTVAAALLVSQDVRIFDGIPSAKDASGDRILAMIRERFERGSNLIFSSVTAGLPDNVARAMILHKGVTLYEGRPDTVFPMYDHFVYRVRRLQHVAERRQEEGKTAGAPSPPDPTPAMLIKRAAQSLDRSKVGALVEDQVERAWRGDQPVILGPYLSDVGFEVLYWRPFVAWMREQYGPRSTPVVMVSRGRVAGWYADLTSHYVDVCDVTAVETFLQRNQERIRDAGSVKQTIITDFEQELLDDVAKRFDAPKSAVLHPSVLHRACSKIWNGAVPSEWLRAHARYLRFSETASPPDVVGGQPYVAVSFWFNSCFSDTQRHRHLVQDVIDELSRRLPVLVIEQPGPLGMGTRDAHERVHRVAPAPEAEDHLRTQAHIIAGASAFIGTFGGISLTAPFYNRPTMMVYGEASGPFARHAPVCRGIADAWPETRLDMAKTTELDQARVGAWIDQALS